MFTRIRSRVDPDSFGELSGVAGGAAGEPQRVAQGLPLGVPGPGRAFVLGGEGAVEDAASDGTCRAAAAISVARTGLLLCGIADEPPPAALGDFADLGPGQRQHIDSDLAERPGRDGERAGQVGDRAYAACATAARFGETGHGGVRRIRFVASDAVAGGLRHGRAGRTRRTRRGCRRRRRAGRAGPADGPSRSCASRTRLRQPAAFRPKVVGTACWVRVRAGQGVSRCSAASRASAAAVAVAGRRGWWPQRPVARPASSRCRGCPGSWRRGGRRRLRPGRRRDGRGEVGDQRDDRVAARAGASGEVAQVELGGAGGGPDGRGRDRRGTARASAWARVEGGLGVEHRLQVRGVAGRRLDRPTRPGPGRAGPSRRRGPACSGRAGSAEVKEDRLLGSSPCSRMSKR